MICSFSFNMGYRGKVRDERGHSPLKMPTMNGAQRKGKGIKAGSWEQSRSPVRGAGTEVLELSPATSQGVLQEAGSKSPDPKLLLHLIH